MKLNDDTILILHVPTGDIPSHRTESLIARLTPDEQQRAALYRFEKDRLAHAVARTLVRQTLAANGIRDPQFTLGEHGKPHLLRIGSAPDVRFNISHCTGMVVAAFTLAHDLGIDVEFLDRRTNDMNVARANFAPTEIDQLEGATPAQQRDIFFKLWTLKEAYVKARGLGLIVPLKDFAFTLDPPRITFAPGMHDDEKHWFFHQSQPGPSHQMALAVQSQRLAVQIEETSVAVLLQAASTR